MKTILVIDDHPLIAEGLGSLLGSRYVIERAASLSEARRLLRSRAWDACVLDISLRGESGLEILGEAASATSVYVLTMHRSPELAESVRSLGARGYFLKDEGLSPLVGALDGTGKDGFLVSEETRALLDGAMTRSPSIVESLTPRERQVFIMLAEGRNYKEIAYSLGISPKTVNIHKASVLEKMSAGSVADLVHLAIKSGLIV